MAVRGFFPCAVTAPAHAVAAALLVGCSTGGSVPAGFGGDAGGGLPSGSGGSGGAASSGSGAAMGSSSSGGAASSSGGRADDGSAAGGSSGGGPGASGSSGASGGVDAGAVGAPEAGAVVDSGGGCTATLGGGPLTPSTVHLDVGAHDPSMIWDGNRYYLFVTGGSLNVRSSPTLLAWSNAGAVLPAVPAWVSAATGSSITGLWAPDVSYFNGQFHVYYAGSTFGSNNSVIGLATTSSLQSPNWMDHGMVIGSKSSDNFNAIDPNVSFDQSCAPWLAYGSFWSGIKLHKLDATTGMLATDDPTTYAIASRNGGAIEAASIVSHNGFYYLFVSFDLCCQGVNSTYRTMAGRATRITGPYVDKAGTDMMQGGADQLLASSGRYIGPGGGTAWRDGDNYLYAYHYYDGQANGASKLQIRPIQFDANDWVSLGDPVFP